MVGLNLSRFWQSRISRTLIPMNTFVLLGSWELHYRVCILPGNEAYTGKFYQPNRILVLVRESLDEDIIQVPISSLLTETVIDVSTVAILNGIISFLVVYHDFCFLKFRPSTN